MTGNAPARPEHTQFPLEIIRNALREAATAPTVYDALDVTGEALRQLADLARDASTATILTAQAFDRAAVVNTVKRIRGGGNVVTLQAARADRIIGHVPEVRRLGAVDRCARAWGIPFADMYAHVERAALAFGLSVDEVLARFVAELDSGRESAGLLHAIVRDEVQHG